MSDDIVNKTMPILRESLGITETETKVLVPIYLGGNMTAGGVSLLTGAKLTSVKRTLTRLIKKGLVREIDGIVPVYRALSPSLALTDQLTETIGDYDDLSGESEKLFSLRLKDVDNVVDEMLKLQSKSEAKLKEALSAYEEEILELVHTQVTFVSSTATSALTALSDEIEHAINSLDTTLDDNLGIKLTELQGEIDKAQIALSKDLKKMVREYNKWLKLEQKGTITSVSEFRTKSKTLVKSAKDAVKDALTQSKESIKKVEREISSTLTSLASTASDDGLAVLNEVSTEISQYLNNLDGELSKSFLAGQNSLKEVVTQARELSKEYGDFAKNKISNAVEIIDSGGAVVDEWKNEVSGFMDVASQSITSQLDQVSTTGGNYLEVVKNSLTTHIDRVNESLTDEYGSLVSLSTELGSECENTLGETRTMVLDLLEKQNKKRNRHCDKTAKNLHDALDQWVDSSVLNIQEKLQETSEDVSTILSTETSELNTIADAMNSRLKSAFKSVIKSTSNKNEAMITAVQKTTNDFERDVGERIDELIDTFTTATEKQVRESKELYEGLRDRLDNRMTKSVSAINSQADRIEKEIATVITEQVERIDQHSKGIQNEFHVRLDEMTSQFMTFIKGLEVTFNGLLASQTLEARDIISSAHTEFRTSLKNEMTTLKDDSVKVQQEYSTELALKIDEVASSVDTAKKALQDLSVQKRTEIADSMAQTLANLEESVKTTEKNLSDLESGTVNQFVENMEQVSEEFRISVDGARDNITERLENIRAATEASLSKSSSDAKTIADTFIADQKDDLQRNLANTSKKINRLATKQVKSSATVIEAFQTSVAEHQTSSMKERSTAKDEVLATLETRRSEVANAFDAAQVWIDSTLSNVGTSLNDHGNKLKNELIIMQKGLQKAANESSQTIQERGDDYVDQVEEITLALFKNTESIITDRLNEFGESTSSSLTKGSDSFTQIPTKIEGELASLENAVSETTSEDYGKIVDTLSGTFTDTERVIDSTSEDMKELVSSVAKAMKEKQSEMIDTVKKNVDLANQHASRKFETIGLELKTQLSSDSSRVVESTNSTISAKNLEISEALSKATNTSNETTSNLKQTRNEALSSYNENADRTLRRWSKTQKEHINSLKDRIQQTIKEVASQTQGTVDLLSTIHELGDDMLTGPTDRTWYLTGTDEACAHILDMAKRADDSVIISVTDPECIDIRRLAKIKKPKRRVLIVPEMEDPIPDLELLDGWRIWQTKTPVLLSVMDDKEILVGGATESEALVAIISEDKTYLQLYHDILGPRLVSGRIH